MSTGKAVAYALDTLQERGRLFVSPGDECYEGMIVGESAKEGDMVVNVEKAKSLGNQRSSSADKAISSLLPLRSRLKRLSSTSRTMTRRSDASEHPFAQASAFRN
ncbi:MAG: hypothetical protein ACLT98_05055 [Eggerthellaceae bacterium]